MNTVSYYEALAGIAACGFIGGFVFGMFLGIWTWATIAGVM